MNITPSQTKASQPTHPHRGTLLWIMGLLLAITTLYPSAAGAADTGASSSDYSCSTNSTVRKHYVNVAVATLWKEPGLARSIDAPSLLNPVDMDKWTSNMNTTSSRKWLTGKTETQALYGQELRLLKVKNDWVYVAVIDQSTPKSKYGYPGWMPKEQMLTTTKGSAYDECPTAVVTAKTAALYNEDKQTKKVTLSFNTRLPVVGEQKDWIKVHTPDNNTALLKKQDTAVYEQLSDIAAPTGDDLVATGKRFLGLPYLWAGVSAYGFDCSGFTSTVYRFYGIDLPRDASAQIKEGTAVSWNHLKPGDLMFFGHNNGKGSIHHVSMYIGDGQMIHSPKAGKTVEIISINTSAYKKEFAGARRYLK